MGRMCISGCVGLVRLHEYDQQSPRYSTVAPHAAITRWRRMMSLGRTWEYQPQQLQNMPLDQEDIKLLQDYMQSCLHK